MEGDQINLGTDDLVPLSTERHSHLHGVAISNTQHLDDRWEMSVPGRPTREIQFSVPPTLGSQWALHLTGGHPDDTASVVSSAPGTDLSNMVAQLT